MKLATLIGAVLISTGAAAQITVPTADGFLSRGTMMWADKNSPGTFDQMRRAITLGESDGEEKALLLEGVAAAATGSPDALRLLDLFLERYPASPLRCYAQMAVGDMDFNQGNWADAFRNYSDIDIRSLNGDMADDLAYRKGFCRLMVGDYDAAAADFSRLDRSPRYAGASRFYSAYIDYARGNYSAALPVMESIDSSSEPGRSAPFYVMQMRFARSEWNQALSSALELLRNEKSNPTQFNVEALRVAGESLYNLGDRQQAVDYLWRYASMAAAPSPSSFYILGVNEYDAGNTDAAVKLLQQVISADNSLAQSAYLILGQCYLRRDDRNSALMAFENASRMDYDRDVREAAMYNYAVTRMDGGRVPFGSSVKMLEEFLADYPDSRYAPEVQKYVVTGYMTDNDYDAALAAINRIKNPSQDIRRAQQRVLFVLATRDYQAGRIAKAETNLNTLQALGKGLDDTLLNQSYLWKGDCRFTNGDYLGAAAQYEKYLKTITRKSPNYLIANYDLGYALFSAGKYGEALKAFGKAEAAAGNDAEPRLKADILNRMGDCRYYSSQFAAALKDYARAYDLLPESGDYALYQLAIVKGMTGDHKGKIAEINRLVGQFPSSGLVPQALLEKAESQAATGDTNGAIATYTGLVDHYATTAPGRNGYLQLALIYLNTGNRRKAEETYRTVISRYPASDEARLAADDLKRMLAADGRLADYAEFVKSVPGAPELDAVEMDQLSFAAAEGAYSTDGATQRLEEYVKNFPNGQSRAKALYYLAESAWNKGDAATAVKLTRRIADNYPHSEAAEQALLIEGEAEISLGKYADALRSFRSLEESASSPGMMHDARMGIMRSASALGQADEVIATADILMGSSATPAESLDEARYLRAEALDQLNRHKEADKEWAALAARPASLYGAMSAVALAESQLNRGMLKEAAATADALINANPPHAYWLARGFIVYSDILRKQGNTFEADEYLKSLRTNYPGKEADIREMINKRLK